MIRIDFLRRTIPIQIVVSVIGGLATVCIGTVCIGTACNGTGYNGTAAEENGSQVSVRIGKIKKTYGLSTGSRPRYRLGNPRQQERAIKRLEPLHQKLGKPEPGDWLSQHQEPGQTFRQYMRARPNTPTGKRTRIYVQPLGSFTPTQQKIVSLSAEYMSIYFQRPVHLLEPLQDDLIPASARRTHPQWGVKQILSTYVLDRVLRPRLPNDAAALIAFTATDLWPGKGWNFVFGQASLRERVGVWSIARNGDPKTDFKLCLRRTLKVATHETGHMFSLAHCTAYECNMCGANHQQESDRHPLYLCPQCHAKICWATGADPVKRFKSLDDFCKQHTLDQEHRFFQREITALGPNSQ